MQDQKLPRILPDVLLDGSVHQSVCPGAALSQVRTAGGSRALAGALPQSFPAERPWTGFGLHASNLNHRSFMLSENVHQHTILAAAHLTFQRPLWLGS